MKEFSLHKFLQELDLCETQHGYNDGVTNMASGKIISSYNPHTGKVIADIILASPE